MFLVIVVQKVTLEVPSLEEIEPRAMLSDIATLVQ